MLVVLLTWRKTAVTLQTSRIWWLNPHADRVDSAGLVGSQIDQRIIFRLKPMTAGITPSGGA